MSPAPHRHALPCPCGQTLAVGTHQAGDQVTCTCGRQVSVPKLRILRQLPLIPLVGAATPAPDARGWNLTFGTLFSLGLLLVVISLASCGYLWQKKKALRPFLKPNDIEFLHGIDELSLNGSWIFWKESSKLRMSDRPTPVSIQAQAKVDEFDRYLRFWGVAAGGGLISMGIAWFLAAKR